MLGSVERPLIGYMRMENKFNPHFVPIGILFSTFGDCIITGNIHKDYKLHFLFRVRLVMPVTFINHEMK